MNPHFFTAPFCFAFIWFKVQGSGGGFAAFFYWGDARKWHLSHQSLVTPTIRGKESSHMRGVRSFGSVPTCSGWGFSHIERFRPLRMTIRGEQMGSHLGDTLHVLELAVLYYDTSSPLEKGRAKGAGWIHEAV